MTPTDRARLAAILGMLGSNHAGERDAAAIQAEAFRKRHRLTWAEMLAVPPVGEPPLVPSDVYAADEARRQQWQAEIRAKAEAERHQWKERARRAADEATPPPEPPQPPPARPAWVPPEPRPGPAPVQPPPRSSIPAIGLWATLHAREKLVAAAYLIGICAFYAWGNWPLH